MDVCLFILTLYVLIYDIVYLPTYTREFRRHDTYLLVYISCIHSNSILIHIIFGAIKLILNSIVDNLIWFICYYKIFIINLINFTVYQIHFSLRCIVCLMLSCIWISIINYVYELVNCSIIDFIVIFCRFYHNFCWEIYLNYKLENLLNL